MRQNLPVTQQQKSIPENFRLVSRTDLEGTIVEANDEFIEISGYSEQELIGQPHNLLRHPDVPAIVFKDMWDTLKAGQGWTQIVKNRAKNGDHYWVKANAAPIQQEGQTTGYISVRIPANENEIALATQAYPLIEQGKLIIHQGQIYQPRQFKLRQINPFKNWTLTKKILVANGVFMLFALLIVLTVREISLAPNLADLSPGLLLQVVNNFTLLSLSLLLLLAAIFSALSHFIIIRPLTVLQAIMRSSQQHGDLSVRAPVHNLDEIGRLAQTYNQQMQNMQVAIGETGRMLAAIAHGKLSTSSTIPMIGDFNLLKASANDGAQAMHQTTQEITKLLYEIRNGNFSYETNTQLKGDYKHAIDYGQTAMVTLKGVFLK